MIVTSSRASQGRFSFHRLFRPRRDTVDRLLARLRIQDEPIRADLLSLEQLRQYARTVASWHRLGARSCRDRLLRRFDENSQILEETHQLLRSLAAEGQEISQAGIWFLDNYYLVQDQIRMARQHLPRKYSMELPQLAGGASDGLPRVYGLALELISHVDGQVDQESLVQFVSAYQEVVHLKLGELWAIPIMLRLGLIENLRRVALRIAWQQRNQRLGETWADRVLHASRRSFGELIRTVDELVAEQLAFNAAFVARFTQRLNGRLPKDNVASQALIEHLAERSLSIDGLVSIDHQGQAADQLSMSNSISSLRALGSLDWKEFVEGQSGVERILREDPAGVYPRMDFASRDHYRHVVEKLARRSPLTEEQVARIAVEYAMRTPCPPPGRSGPASGSEEVRQRHVGYFLIDRGQPLLEESIGYRRTWNASLARLASRSPLGYYLGTILLVWLVATGGVAMLGWQLDAWRPVGPVPFLLVLMLFAGAASQFAVSVVNWLCTLMVPPRPLMRLDFSAGIPGECHTLVAVPTMLTSEHGVRSLVDQLEMRYLANQDEHLLFALVTDFPDADEETLPDDAKLIAIARDAIERLNKEYCRNRRCSFYLFHRPRKWNGYEGVWMGEERKRGKLAALNRLLRTGARDAFSAVVGDLGQLAAVRYVITLDTDTQLPRDVGRELVGCMAHPLNQPVIDPETHRVAEGYAILQPRVATTIPESQRSPFSRLFVGDAGIDPYTSQTSDVYQDVFGEGSFIGKGIYDVYAFEVSLERRFPDNRVLSHDLIEGCFARSGLVNNVELFEGYPSRLLADMSRRHRWIRGDWQIAAWLRRRIPAAVGSQPNPLSGLSRWKIFDNLRRSLAPVFLLGFLLLGWCLIPDLAGVWTLVGLATVFGTAILSSLPGVFRKPEQKPWKLHLKDHARSCWRTVSREAVAVCVLPYTVHCHLDAIGRTVYRLYISRKRLLEWTTAGEAEVRSEGTCRDHYEVMWACVVAGLACAAWLSIVAPGALVAAAPFVVAWFLGPWLAWRISQPCSLGVVRLKQVERERFHRWARQTWHFFDTFVTEQDHWLPPDNVQQRPDWTVATRTSPTNIGMGLLANLAAYDFGYLPATGLLDRTGRTLGAMDELDRYRGHFYNWYDTRTLKPAEPRYVSSVDSGNLWGALIILGVGLKELRDRPLVSPRLWDGLHDTLEVITACYQDSPPLASVEEFVSRLVSLLDRCETARSGGIQSTCDLLRQIQAMGEELANYVPPEQPSLHEWVAAFVRQCEHHRRDLAEVAFWTQTTSLHAFKDDKEDEDDALPSEQQQLIDDLRSKIRELDSGCTLGNLLVGAEQVIADAGRLEQGLAGLEGDNIDYRDRLRSVVSSLRAAAEQAAANVRQQWRTIDLLEQACQQFATMDFRFLFHPIKKLLAIGFNVSEHRTDASYYDLLASESRLASFLAISHGQIPQEHWFTLGRMVTLAEDVPTLLSWSGSMFEYLMPMLVMPSYPASLLDASCRAAVRHQIRYARAHGVPWGISESCYNLTDANQSYRYRAFGVPGLGLERGLDANLVIAPYASAMASMVAPREACSNLDLLERLGYLSSYGFYDAIDYTPERRLSDDQPARCRTVMAHHSGMALLAFGNVLFGGPMPRRFLQAPLCRAHDLLLQERVSQAVRPIDPDTLDASESSSSGSQIGRTSVRAFDTPHSAVPEVHLLSNGRYHVAMTGAGGSLSRYGNLAVTRWHADPTRDHFGQFCYLRDVETGDYWSTTYHPTRRKAEKCQTVFSQGRVEYRLLYGEVDARTQVSVSPEDNVEVRRLTLTNLARLRRTIELTTYAEVVLATAESDRAHRAFSNLFVETELLPQAEAILAARRPRMPEESPVWIFHLLHVEAARKTAASFETSRERFIGRTRSLESPLALERLGPLGGSQGAVLDPVVSVRQAMTLDSEESAVVYIITGVSESREKASAAIERYCDPRLAARVFELSRAQSQLVLQRLRMTEAEAQLYAHLAGAILYADPRYRASPTLISQYLRSQSALWALGLSGDRPIVVVRYADRERIGLVEQLLSAHAYWRDKGLEVDLVIWVDSEYGGHQGLHAQVMDLLGSNPHAQLMGQPGGVFVYRSDQYHTSDFMALQAAARIYFSDAGGLLEEQVKQARPAGGLPLPSELPRSRQEPVRGRRKQAVPDLMLFNGLGGFTRDGREYVSVVHPDRPTPAPWCNVLANPTFGSVVSESSLGCTWNDNSQQFRLTPWNNDPTCDPAGEAIYVTDEETGEFFSATPQPAPSRHGYLCRHGFGYTVWQTDALEIESRLSAFVSVDRPAKFLLLTVKNRATRRRRVSITCFVEWVLGENRDKTRPYLISEVDPQNGAVLARNVFHPEFNRRVSFLNVSETNRSVTGDRAEFLGRNGSPARPAALRKAALSGRVGAALDPAGVIRCEVELAPGEEHEVCFVLGAGSDMAQARELAGRLAHVATARQELSRVWEHWKTLLGVIQVETPEPALDVLANGWLLYQTLACRFWGRSAFYQSGGAYGFRDQLQDSLALLESAPQLARQHLLACAARQFQEGDVQHWWHPTSGQGIRTRVSDDYLWLALVACQYVRVTGDAAVWEEVVPFLIERRLEPHEESLFSIPSVGKETASLYEHCRRAIQYGLKFGTHGLPLMGSGDWNDGLNRVGINDKGESVWLAMFLIKVLREFLSIAQQRDDHELADVCRTQAERLQTAIAEHGWDGRWFRRAYFDDGTPLGSQQNDECQIDSLSQSWAVLAAAAPPAQLHAAMQAVSDRLVRRDLRVIQLLVPPFDQGTLQPGYVKGYLPGVRENGGQYTHAAIWATMAFAEMGDTERAWECFRMINPANHAASPESAEAYKVEPYVVAADVYTAPAHPGRGGWTWYTGSSGWMYQLIVHSLLGVELTSGRRLRFRPCPAEGWTRYRVTFRHHRTPYQIDFFIVGKPGHHVAQVTMDGVDLPEREVELVDDGRSHHVVVTLGSA